MCWHDGRNRAGFTPIELLVVLAIAVTLIALLLPALQKFREAASGLTCRDRLRRLALAGHHCNDTRHSLPAGLGWFPSPFPPGAYGTALFHLLPYIEQDHLYRNAAMGPYYFAAREDLFAHPLALYRCPSDPSVGPGGVVRDADGVTWGASSYAWNAQVFCQVSSAGVFLDAQGQARLAADFPDGTSRTILFAEKYADCDNDSYPAGGNYWAYWITGAGVRPCHPGFAISWNGSSIGPGSKFQSQPTPYRGGCDPTRASSPHPGGIHVGMGDGSVRCLSAGITPSAWWSLCTPAGGEEVSPGGEEVSPDGE